MYTRSYASHPRTGILPPDYGGTALTVSPPSPPQETPAGGERPRRPLEKETREPLRPDHPPFGGNGQPEAAEAAPSLPENTKASVTENAFFPDPAALKTDDLLLLGLILMLLFDSGGSDSGREAILLLVILYLSGI